MALDQQGKYEEADLLFLIAIRVQEIALGAGHPHLATTLHHRAMMMMAQVIRAFISGRVSVLIRTFPEWCEKNVLRDRCVVVGRIT